MHRCLIKTIKAVTAIITHNSLFNPAAVLDTNITWSFSHARRDIFDLANGFLSGVRTITLSSGLRNERQEVESKLIDFSFQSTGDVRPGRWRRQSAIELFARWCLIAEVFDYHEWTILSYSSFANNLSCLRFHYLLLNIFSCSFAESSWILGKWPGRVLYILYSVPYPPPLNNPTSFRR